MAGSALRTNSCRAAPSRHSPPTSRPFLTAAWRHLAMLNYRVDPQWLLPLVPSGTQLDLYHGEAIVTLVGFMFERARLFGICIPWHQQFAEVNLRFYVRRLLNGETRQGVVFIKEMVPKRMVAWTARYLYGERFARVPVECRIYDHSRGAHNSGRVIEYAWERGSAAGQLSLTADVARPAEPPQGEAAFVIDRTWAYTAGRAEYREYRVTHRPWRTWPAETVQLAGKPEIWYGRHLGCALRCPPRSAFLVDGSEVEVFRSVST